MFRVPRSSDWPEHMWDQPLGSYVRGMRYDGGFAKQVRADQVELERLEFSSGLALSGRKRREKVVPKLTVNAIPDNHRLEGLDIRRNDPEWKWSERILPALEAFRRLNGHCRVPQRYAVPSDKNWPRLSWDLNLGSVASKIRQGAWFAQVARSKTRLEELGFVWDVAESDWSERIIPALETFRTAIAECQ